MKKTIAVLLTLCIAVSFSACQSGGEEDLGSVNGNGGNPVAGQETAGPTAQLTYVGEMMGRYSTQEGFYFYKAGKAEQTIGDSYENLMYIDYAAGRQIYLCNKSNCSHNDAGCTSYMPLCGAQGLFTYDGKLYRLSNAYAEDGAATPGLFVSDLDGSNSRQLYKLSSGSQWLRDFVFGNGMLYADVMVMQPMGEEESGLGAFMTGDDNNSRLLAVDLESGNAEIILDLTDKKIVGTFEQWIILGETRGDRLVFSRYSPETGETQPIKEIDHTYAFCVGDAAIYYSLPGENTLYALDMASGETAVLAEKLPSAPDSLEFHDGRVLCTTTGSEGTQFYYGVDTKHAQTDYIDLYQSGVDFSLPVKVEAEWGEYFLVITGLKMGTEYVDWVGVWQEYIDSELFAMIKKDDFFAGKPEYLPVVE